MSGDTQHVMRLRRNLVEEIRSSNTGRLSRSRSEQRSKVDDAFERAILCVQSTASIRCLLTKVLTQGCKEKVG